MLTFLVNFTNVLYEWLLIVFLFMHLKANILRISRENSRFDLTTSYKRKYVTKPILVNLGTRIFKNFSPVQTIVVPPGETNISKLLTALFIFIRALSLKVDSTVYLYWVWVPQRLEILPSCFKFIFKGLLLVLRIFFKYLSFENSCIYFILFVGCADGGQNDFNYITRDSFIIKFYTILNCCSSEIVSIYIFLLPYTFWKICNLIS